MSQGIERAKAIKGWMSDGELAWLAERAANCRAIAEVGSAWGKSTRVLGDNVREGGRVYAVDTWAGPCAADRALEAVPASWGADDTGSAAYDGEGGDAIFAAFKENLGDLLSQGRVVALRMPSKDAAAAAPDGFDLVFLDASHDAMSVVEDVLAWRPKVAPGGILSGHDYSNVPWQQVRPVVDLAFGDRVGVHETIWWVRL